MNNQSLAGPSTLFGPTAQAVPLYDFNATFGEHSITTGKIAKALAAVQSEIEDAKFNRVNPHFKNKYADLTAIFEACRKVLSKHNIAVTQITTSQGQYVTVVTYLLHESGEYIRGALTLKASQENAQQAGSALTYARRYSLAAIVGIASDEDDDGEVSDNGKNAKQPQEIAKKATVKDPAKATLNEARLRAVWDDLKGSMKSADFWPWLEKTLGKKIAVDEMTEDHFQTIETASIQLTKVEVE